MVAASWVDVIALVVNGLLLPAILGLVRVLWSMDRRITRIEATIERRSDR